jgi:hypothetical protein
VRAVVIRVWDLTWKRNFGKCLTCDTKFTANSSGYLRVWGERVDNAQRSASYNMYIRYSTHVSKQRTNYA